MVHSYDGIERRKFSRYHKNFSLFFYVKGSSYKKSDEIFISDISKGGVHFLNSKDIKAGTELAFEIGIPFIAPEKLVLEGSVVSSREITPRLVYEIRAKFNPMNDHAAKLFDMIEKQNQKDQKAHGLH